VEWQQSCPNLAQALAPEFRTLPRSQVEAIVSAAFGESIDLEDVEGIFDDVGSAFKSAAKVVAPVLTRALPGMLSGAVSGAPLGPWGMLGGALVGGTTAALGGGAKPSRQPPPGMPVLSAGPPSVALGQLLGVLASPTTQQALASMMLGPSGTRTVPTAAGVQVPVAAITNLLSLLANRASAEWEGTSAPYVGDDYVAEGFDSANPDVRADVLYAQLAPVDLSGEDTAGDESWLDEMYDEAEAVFYSEPIQYSF